MGRTKSEIYLDAAERIFDQRNAFACTAIEMASGYSSFWRIEFEQHFKPEGENSGVAWFGKWSEPENQLARQLALLLMSEIAKDE